MKEFKIRASSCGQIMSNNRAGTGMGEAAKTYCKDWLKSQLYERKQTIESKYFDKGNLCELDAIEFVSMYFPDLPLLIKNEKSFESDFITGTPDLILPSEIIDIKCPWDAFTFPLFDTELPEKNYYWQLQCYMSLTGIEKGRIIYVLMDTPMELIEREIRFNPAREDEILAYHSYSNVPDKLRIKCFDVARNEIDIEAIKNRVVECKSYIKSLIN